MKSSVVRRTVLLTGHKTSVSVESEFWNGLRAIADERNMTLSDLIGAINKERRHPNLSSAIRLFVLAYYRDRLSAQRKLRENPHVPLVPE